MIHFYLIMALTKHSFRSGTTSHDDTHAKSSNEGTSITTQPEVINDDGDDW